jgi:hypothetical protein
MKQQLFPLFLVLLSFGAIRELLTAHQDGHCASKVAIEDIRVERRHGK